MNWIKRLFPAVHRAHEWEMDQRLVGCSTYTCNRCGSRAITGDATMLPVTWVTFVDWLSHCKKDITR